MTADRGVIILPCFCAPSPSRTLIRSSLLVPNAQCPMPNAQCPMPND
ncbi:hypothetical protein [Nostoc linckia]|nr:hypothetical protein [Nostoc linckia]